MSNDEAPIAWQSIRNAPKDGRRILARYLEKSYVGVVVWNGREWEAVDFNGRRLEHGFSPTGWADLGLST